ncbi:MAG: MBL fold metallo-hydrolase [Clostridia bacterium]|nr:MBL fold metallo-hydrolase [Clostridia bacterium]
MKKKLLVLLMLCLAVFASASAQENRWTQVFDTAGDAGNLSIRFLWMGPQAPEAEDKPGDCMILTSPDGKVMVLDSGHPLSISYVTDALDAMGITKIDYLVASHPHIDHIGGFAALMDQYEIGAVYTSELEYTSSSYYRAYMDAIAAKNIEHVILRDGDTLAFGDAVTVNVYNPTGEAALTPEEQKNKTEFINNQSLALKFTYGESTVMLAGDLYVGGEKAIVARWGEALDCDVMKANHHGANTSSSKVWRDAVSPQITFISSDAIEDVSIAKKYTKNGQKMYHTLLDGAICLRTAGAKDYAVVTEKDRTTTMFD